MTKPSVYTGGAYVVPNAVIPEQQGAVFDFNAAMNKAMGGVQAAVTNVLLPSAITLGLLPSAGAAAASLVGAGGGSVGAGTVVWQGANFIPAGVSAGAVLKTAGSLAMAGGLVTFGVATSYTL